MKINMKIDYVEGSFDTKKGKIICVGTRKYGQVNLSFKGNMHIPFAKIKLYSRDLAIDADATFEDAKNLGNEIARRWNEFEGEKKFNKGMIVYDLATNKYMKDGINWIEIEEDHL